MTDYPNDVTRHPLDPDNPVPDYLRVSRCLRELPPDRRTNEQKQRAVVVAFQGGRCQQFRSLNRAATVLQLNPGALWLSLKSGRLNSHLETPEGIVVGVFRDPTVEKL